MAKPKKLFSTIKKAETVNEKTVQNSQLTFEQVMEKILGKPIKILELNCSGINGMEDPNWKYVQFVTINPNGTYSRYELGTIKKDEFFFDFTDPIYELDSDEVSDAV